MKERTPPPDGLTDSGFWSRWSARKQADRELEEPIPPAEEHAAPPELEPRPLTDEDMPPLESLGENSDYSGFLSPEVSDGLRRLALRKLFHGADFNVCDGLDDYAEDFTSFEKLGDLVTADMSFQMEQAARRAEQEASGEALDDQESPERDETGPVEAKAPVEDADIDPGRGGGDRLAADDEHDESEIER